ncbi:MAG: hypothetical protein V2B20_22585 [Pseudomonadota bacterium]
MFYKFSDDNFQSIMDGIAVKTGVVGEKMLVSELRIAKGSRLPMYRHHQEQTGGLLRGNNQRILRTPC